MAMRRGTPGASVAISSVHLPTERAAPGKEHRRSSEKNTRAMPTIAHHCPPLPTMVGIAGGGWHVHVHVWAWACAMLVSPSLPVALIIKPKTRAHASSCGDVSRRCEARAPNASCSADAAVARLGVPFARVASPNMHCNQAGEVAGVLVVVVMLAQRMAAGTIEAREIAVADDDILPCERSDRLVAVRSSKSDLSARRPLAY